jgi:phage terminase large subunit GpA-like protein
LFVKSKYQRVASKNDNSGLKAKQNVAFTADEAHEVVRCMQDPVYFIRKYIKIVHPDKGLVAFDLYPFQERLIRLLDKERYVIGKCPRQCGKTSTVTSYLLWYVLNHEFVSVAVIANKEKTAHNILKKLKLAYLHLPKFLKTGIVRWNEGDIEFENGSSVIAAATSSSAIRGGTFNCVLIDEMAFIPNNLVEEFYTSTYPVISAGKTTKIFIISTPQGMNLFYNLWCQATNADPRKRSRFQPFEAHWSEVPGRDQAWVDETKANLDGESKWLQEFECISQDTHINVRDASGYEYQTTAGELWAKLAA